jgi:four helix bundle protein
MGLGHARSFTELVVWQKARVLSRRVLALSRGFPREEAFSLTDQIRRASRSVGAQIAESWAKRNYEKHFISKLTDADAEQYETRHWIIVAMDAGYLTKQEAEELGGLCIQVGAMLGEMISRSADFCAESLPTFRETSDTEFCIAASD